MPSSSRREFAKSERPKAVYILQLVILFFFRITLILISSGFHLTEKLERKRGMGILFSESYLPWHSQITICSSNIKTYFKLIFAHMPPNYFHLIYLYGSPRNAVFNLFGCIALNLFTALNLICLFLFFTIFLLMAFRILFSNNLNWCYIAILIPYCEQIYKNLQIINSLKKGR